MNKSILLDLISESSLLFRLGKDAKANEVFARFMDVLMRQLPSISKNVDINGLNQILNEMFLAQSHADYLYLADLLEYEVGPILEPRDTSIAYH